MRINLNVLSGSSMQFDYSLTGVNATLAVEKGLAEAGWYQCPMPRETMLENINVPAQQTAYDQF